MKSHVDLLFVMPVLDQVEVSASDLKPTYLD